MVCVGADVSPKRPAEIHMFTEQRNREREKTAQRNNVIKTGNREMISISS